MKKEVIVPPPSYICSWSGGKDSTATIILAHEHNEPLDLIVFTEVMFDKNISGELPEHIDFMKNKCIPIFNEWGYTVKILHSSKTYLDEFYQYIGIAIDEKKRLQRFNKRQISLLAKYNYTEEMAFELCRKYGLLSPIYSFSKRGGCWFCPNAKDPELRNLRKCHREYWDKLLWLEEQPNLICCMWNALKKTSIHDKEEQFKKQDL